MKTLFKLSRSIKFLLAICLISLLVSCKEKETQDGKLKKLEQTEKLEDDESFAGSSKRKDICQLLTKADIRSVFELSDVEEIKQNKIKSAICSYKWEVSGETTLFYSFSLNFARGEKRNSSQINAVWRNQNDKLYKRHNLQEVSGVGDKATWSKLGGGQLRVAAKGYIFYVSHSVMVMPGNDKPDDTKTMIDKTKKLAKLVINRM